MQRYKGAEVCDVLRLHLGDDWEMRLIAANAVAGPNSTKEEVRAAQQRAVALVRDSSPGWVDDMSEHVAEAWLDGQTVSPRVARGLRRLRRRRSRRVARWSS